MISWECKLLHPPFCESNFFSFCFDSSHSFHQLVKARLQQNETGSTTTPDKAKKWNKPDFLRESSFLQNAECHLPLSVLVLVGSGFCL